MDVSASIVVLSTTLLALAYYFVRIAKKPDVSFPNTYFNNAVVRLMPQLRRRFYISPWLISKHLQMLFMGLEKTYVKPLHYERSDVLTMSDGGVVSVDWVGLDLPEDTPTMVVLHTISGSPESMRPFVRYVFENMGWRVALCVRRGHGTLGLKSPNYNSLGSSDDFVEQLAHIEQAFPKSNLYATGISMGSGVLVHYLGRAGLETPLKAAFAYCPAYDAVKALPRLSPRYSRVMAKKLIKLFIEPNRSWFGQLDNYAQLCSVDSVAQFHDEVYLAAGYASSEELLTKHNPMTGFDNIRVPILLLNADDDPICVKQNVDDNMGRISNLETAILVTTQRGSHCCHYEGLLARSWSNALVKEYFFAIERLNADLASEDGS